MKQIHSTSSIPKERSAIILIIPLEKKKKNSNDIENRTRDLQACSAVPHPTAPPRAHKLFGYNWKI
jgi:hypothetical protein